MEGKNKNGPRPSMKVKLHHNRWGFFSLEVYAKCRNKNGQYLEFFAAAMRKIASAAIAELIIKA